VSRSGAGGQPSHGVALREGKRASQAAAASAAAGAAGACRLSVPGSFMQQSTDALTAADTAREAGSSNDRLSSSRRGTPVTQLAVKSVAAACATLQL
jgi:hypothetical protein